MWKVLLGVLTALPRLVRLLARYLRARADRAAIRRVREFRKAVGKGDTDEVTRRLDDLLLRGRHGRGRGRGRDRLPPESGVYPK